MSDQSDDLTAAVLQLPPHKRALVERWLEEQRRRSPAPIPRASTPTLSYAQERLWYLHQIEGHTGAYNIVRAFRLRGRLDRHALQQALEMIARRHEILRTTYPSDGGIPRAEIAPPERFSLPLPVVAARKSQLDQLLARANLEPFDLGAGPILRATLLALGPEDHVLMLVIHEIASDGWSFGILLRELSLHYSHDATLTALELGYSDYAAWQRAQPLDLSYWLEALRGAPEILELPADRPRPPVSSFRGSVERFAIDADISELARETSATPFMIYFAAFAAYLFRRTGEEDLLIGTPIGNRPHRELEHVLGFFVNMMALRARPRAAISFREFLGEIRKTVLDAYQYSDAPFEKLIEKIAPDRGPGRTPLFQVMFAFQSTPREALELAGLEVRPIDPPGVTSKFDLSLMIEEQRAALEYSIDLFESATGARMAAELAIFMPAAIRAPDTMLARLPLLSDRRMLTEWNDTARDYPAEVKLSQLIAEQAAKTPQAIAAVFGDQRLSYAELERRASVLASSFQPRSTVPVSLERGLDLLITLIAVMKAGASYLPLDPSQPRERLELMIADSAATPAEDSIYTIYTSGPGGRPKSVEIRHRSVINVLLAMKRALDFQPKDVLLAVTPITLDIAALELFLPLISGGRVVIASREVAADGAKLAGLIAASDATIMQATPSTWRRLLSAGWKGAPGLRIVCGGEPLSSELARELCARGREVFHVYGRTETTIWSSFDRVVPGERLTIGRPLDNTRFYIVDRSLEPVPIGVPGELLIAGDGLARGYRNYPPDEFRELEPFGRVYHTGDRARWLPDGRVELLGGGPSR